jgi:drug/metabolite transporter (DMT)-like permease
MNAIFALLFAATMWGILWYPLRLLNDIGLDGLGSSLFMYAGTVFAAVYLLRGRWQEIRRAPIALLILCVTAGWTNIAFILAILDGTVVRVLLLFYLSPVWAILLAWSILGERITLRVWGVFALAMTGALIMLWHEESGLPYPQNNADWLALSSGFCFAISNVVMRKTQSVSVNVKSVVAWFGVVLLAVTILGFRQSSIMDLNVFAVLAAFILGATMIVFMTLSVAYGVSHLPVHQSAIILLFELVVGAVSAMLLTNETILLREWIGGALVISAAYFSARESI